MTHQIARGLLLGLFYICVGLALGWVMHAVGLDPW